MGQGLPRGRQGPCHHHSQEQGSLTSGTSLGMGQDRTPQASPVWWQGGAGDWPHCRMSGAGADGPGVLRWGPGQGRGNPGEGQSGS